MNDLFYMIHWTPPQQFLLTVCSIHRLLCQICTSISSGDWQSASRAASYIFPYSFVLVFVFCVNSGSGELEYQRKKYKLGRGDCVFIDCQQPYSHSTDKDLWSLSWIHFSGVTMQDIYRKYQERGGCPVFHPENITAFAELHKSLFMLASSDDYIRDMRINSGLNELLVLLMKESWHPAERSDAILKSRTLNRFEIIWIHTTPKNVIGCIGRPVLYQQVLSDPCV